MAVLEDFSALFGARQEMHVGDILELSFEDVEYLLSDFVGRILDTKFSKIAFYSTELQ
jgi:hypothetical protein